VAPRLLIVDDEPDGREALADLARSWGWEALCAPDGAAALPAAEGWQPDAIVSDLFMPSRDGMWLLRALRAELPEVPVILLTGQASIPLAVEAIQEGAYDFIEKPPAAARLRLVLDRALRKRQAHRELELLRGRLAAVEPRALLLGESPATCALRELVRRVAPAAASVVIQGPSGVGKEAVGRMVHDLSPRREGPFLAVNCAALPAPLVEAELFGHERGAFTGARERRPGLLEMASGGTLFLDEVADLPLDVQGTFLRVLEDRRVRRLGGRSEIEVDLRVLAATHRDLRSEVRAGRFREDLYFRLAVFTIDVPPLAERLEDVAGLARHFAGRLAAEAGRPAPEFGAEALQALREHSWPGNVRELRNAVHRAYVLSDGPAIDERCVRSVLSARNSGSFPAVATPASAAASDAADPVRGEIGPGLPASEGGAPASEPSGAADPFRDDPLLVRVRVGDSLEAVEKELLMKTLEAFGGNKKKAAEKLGISLKTIYNKIRLYGL
jgi:DNA-binding NtrC family response regulator